MLLADLGVSLLIYNIGVVRNGRKLQLFLQKIGRVFHISQNYSIFALDFAYFTKGWRVTERKTEWFFERNKIFANKFCKFKKIAYLCTPVESYADVAQLARAADL